MTVKKNADAQFPYVNSYWAMDVSFDISLALAGKYQTEVLIVGAGFAGLSAALGLIEARPDLSVTIIEAHHAGYGASGRNSGHIFNLPPMAWLVQDLSNRQQQSKAKLSVQLVEAQCQKTFDTLAKAGLDIELQKTDLQIVASNIVTAAGTAWLRDRLNQAGIETEFYEADDAQKRIGSKARAIMNLPTHVVQPFKLAQSLRSLLLQRGVTFFEQTPAARIESNPSGVFVTTPSGSIEAKTLVLTTNAYAAENKLDLNVARPKSRNSHTYMIATETLSDQEISRITASGAGFGDAALSFYYGRIHNRRFLFGGGDRKTAVSQDDDRHEQSFVALRHEMIRRFPFLAETPLYAAWGGAFQSTLMDLPLIRRIGPARNVVLNTAYGGNGVSGALLSGRLVPSLVLADHADDQAEMYRRMLDQTRVPWAGFLRAGFGLASTFIRRML